MTQNEQSPTINRRFQAILPLVVLLTFFLNLHGLAADSFWGDEILTAIYASRSPADIIAWTAEDIHPPFYYLLAGGFAWLTISLGSNLTTPASDWLWRFPSALAVVLSVAVTYRLARCSAYCVVRNKNYPIRPTPHDPRPAATYAALLLSVAPIAIKYGQEARMHALFMLLAALSTWFFFRAIRQPDRWSRWLVYSLAMTATLYTMYFGFLILAAHGIFVVSDFIQTKVWTPKQNEPTPPAIRIPQTAIQAILGFSAASALAFLLYVPWWPVLFNILRRRAVVGAIEGGVGDPLAFGLGVVEALGPSPLWVAWLFLMLFAVGLLWLARRSWPLAVFAAAWLLLPLALPMVLGDPRALQFRYAFVLPVYLTVIAYGITGLGRSIEPKHTAVSSYLVWVLATLSFISTLDIYQQTKPNWRAAAAYLDEQIRPADLILIGPLWDEGRFIDYYYRGQARLLTPAALVTNIERHAAELRDYGGRIWAVNRFAPAESPALRTVEFEGVVVSEPILPVYESELLTQAAIDLSAQAVEAAYPWATKMESAGVLDPDPRTAQAAALRALGDTLMAANRPEEALAPYQQAVDIFPGWVSGFIALAEAQQAAGNLPAAVDAYQQAVAFNLDWHGPAADEANDYAQSGQWETALHKYQQIIGD